MKVWAIPSLTTLMEVDELVGEQGVVVFGENLACIRISLYCSTKFV